MTDSLPDELKTEAVSIKKNIKYIKHCTSFRLRHYSMVITKILYNKHFTSYSEYV